MIGWIGMFWGVFGFLVLLGQAVGRLWPLALEPLQMGGLALWQYVIYAASVLLMAYSEGYCR